MFNIIYSLRLPNVFYIEAKKYKVLDVWTV